MKIHIEDFYSDLESQRNENSFMDKDMYDSNSERYQKFHQCLDEYEREIQILENFLGGKVDVKASEIFALNISEIFKDMIIEHTILRAKYPPYSIQKTQ
jgi:hypothetical protein